MPDGINRHHQKKIQVYEKDIFWRFMRSLFLQQLFLIPRQPKIWLPD